MLECSKTQCLPGKVTIVCISVWSVNAQSAGQHLAYLKHLLTREAVVQLIPSNRCDKCKVYVMSLDRDSTHSVIYSAKSASEVRIIFDSSAHSFQRVSVWQYSHTSVYIETQIGSCRQTGFERTAYYTVSNQQLKSRWDVSQALTRFRGYVSGRTATPA